ncbi:MAG: hypothetical protein H6625_00075 [Bdellovibrionaceae bacterium]|nr:hypothetical protein [Pseudobdellovibrionaceae bacterium]
MSFGRQRNLAMNIHDEIDSEGSWAISYGDMVTLLLAFFVLFFSVDPQVEKEQALQESLMTSLQLDNKSLKERSPSTLENSGSNSNMNLGNVKEAENIDKEVMHQWGAQVYTVGKRLIIDFPNTNFFSLGQIELNKDGKELLNTFVDRYMPFAGQYVLNIRAFTDSRPVLSTGYRYKDNLELSALRAIAAMRHLQLKGIPLDRMNLAGYGVLKFSEEELAEIKDKFKIDDPMSYSRKVVLVIEPEPKKEGKG